VIQRDSFRPVPRVDSAVVVVRRKKTEVPVRSERIFADMVRFMFTQRRKKAGKVLRQYLEAFPGHKDLANRIILSLRDVRVFQLAIGDFEKLSNEIASMKRERLD
jgi:16S rRNA A1518/A1519 N6-dimethyltransferase RsmA/KsgA/DIM1 with predicted DNA glycosylase/AP lyase activity